MTSHKEIKKAVEEGLNKPTKKKTPSNSEDFKKYRWFITSSKKVIVGGKNSEQNESLIKNLIQSENDYIVMHTKRPGSPFTILPTSTPTEEDIDETAIFTACFSQAWKAKAKKISVDIFKTSSIYKRKGMKQGTFGVKKIMQNKIVEPKLYLTKQKSVLRAIPQEKKNAITIIPGNISKEKIAEQIAKELKIKKEEVEQALPAGNSQIVKD
jgi:hydroxymethylpyrimidine pyrophosphatase-like HAD family hydrolase